MTIFLSASSIRDFIHCSKMFYFRTNCPEESVDSQDMNIGNIVHWTIEKFWDDPIKASDFIEENVKKYSIDKQGDNKVRDCVSVFFNEFPDLYRKLSGADAIEYKFQETLSDGIVMRGKIDRLLTDYGIIIDWKTGTTKKNISNDVQFIIYYSMYKKIFGRPPSKLLQVNLTKKEIVEFYPNKEYIDTLFNKVIPYMVNRIKAQEYIKEGYFNGSCYRCAYDTVCYKDR